MWHPAETPDERACVFCDLLVSVEARWVAREADVVAFLPLPSGELAPGHTLVLPRAHHVGVLDTPTALLGTTMDMVQRVGRAMTEELGATGVVVLNASGPFSGQSVDHLHFHVVPCWPDDEATFWPADRSAHQIEGSLHSRLAGAAALQGRRS
jgi:histidine triad (HIT) family protein